MLDDPAQHRPLTVGGLERLLETVGIGAAAAARTTICGRDPVLPSRFPLGAAAVTAPAGCGVAAARCLEVRANVTQEVRVSVPRAAASLASYTLQRLDGKELAAPPTLSTRSSRPTMAAEFGFSDSSAT
jgi:hypothetical protein